LFNPRSIQITSDQLPHLRQRVQHDGGSPEQPSRTAYWRLRFGSTACPGLDV